METKKLILFGCGNLGYEALYFLGEKNVECFCDNHPNVVGKSGAGKKNIISFETLVQKYKDQIVVLCVVDDRDICNMAKQCEERGVYDYLAYTAVKEKANSREASLAYIMNPQNRMYARKEKNKSISNDIEREKAKTVKRFCPPTLQEVQAYIQEKGYSIDAEAFIAFYESKGWMVGKNKMKDWRMAIVTWSKRDNRPATKKKSQTNKSCNDEWT